MSWMHLWIIFVGDNSNKGGIIGDNSNKVNKWYPFSVVYKLGL